MLLVTPRKKTCSNALTRGRVEPASYPRTMVRDDKTMMFKHGEQNDSQFNEREKNKVQIQTQTIIFDLWKAGDRDGGQSYKIDFEAR